MDCYTDTRKITLTDALPPGGEGTIHYIAWHPDWVVKIYHEHKLCPELKNKIAFMINNPPGKTDFLTWPQELVYADSQRRQFIGYIMLKYEKNYLQIYKLYNHALRNAKCPDFNWLYAHQAAANLALAIHTVHTTGYVVGDINEKNVIVNNQSLIKLIDTDSFQAHDQNRKQKYRCTVGVTQYTPPELIGLKFEDCDRTINHDSFGLAVLIFQLLMLGIHPFDGDYLGSDDAPAYSDRIKKGMYPYSPSSKYLKPSTNAFPYEAINSKIRCLFNRCFIDGHNNPTARPSAHEWYKTITEVINE